MSCKSYYMYIVVVGLSKIFLSKVNFEIFKIAFVAIKVK